MIWQVAKEINIYDDKIQIGMWKEDHTNKRIYGLKIDTQLKKSSVPSNSYISSIEHLTRLYIRLVYNN